MHIIRRVIMSVKSMYRIGFSYLQKSGKENNLDLDSKKFQRKALVKNNYHYKRCRNDFFYIIYSYENNG